MSVRLVPLLSGLTTFDMWPILTVQNEKSPVLQGIYTNLLRPFLR